MTDQIGNLYLSDLKALTIKVDEFICAKAHMWIT